MISSRKAETLRTSMFPMQQAGLPQARQPPVQRPRGESSTGPGHVALPAPCEGRSRLCGGRRCRRFGRSSRAQALSTDHRRPCGRLSGSRQEVLLRKRAPRMRPTMTLWQIESSIDSRIGDGRGHCAHHPGVAPVLQRPELSRGSVLSLRFRSAKVSAICLSTLRHGWLHQEVPAFREEVSVWRLDPSLP